MKKGRILTWTYCNVLFSRRMKLAKYQINIKNEKYFVIYIIQNMTNSHMYTIIQLKYNIWALLLIAKQKSLFNFSLAINAGISIEIFVLINFSGIFSFCPYLFNPKVQKVLQLKSFYGKSRPGQILVAILQRKSDLSAKYYICWQPAMEDIKLR